MQLASMEENATGYLLQKGKIAWYFDNYFNPGDDRTKASPLYGEFSDGLPATLVFTAQFCPLRDEGTLYVQKVNDAGGKAQLIHFPDMIHTFLNMEDLVKSECESVYTSIADFLK